MNYISITKFIPDNEFDQNLTNEKIVRMRDIPIYRNKEKGILQDKIQSLYNFLKDKSDDFFINGITILNLEDYEELKQKLIDINYGINKVFIKIKNRAVEQKEGIEMLGGKIDITIEDVRRSDWNNNKDSLKLIRQLQKDGVDFQIVD